MITGLLLSLSSCKSYMMSTVSSPNTQKDEFTGIQKMENDSLTISYNFAGDNTPLKIDIYNKLNEPIYVNWEHSALIVDETAYSFVDETMKLEAFTNSSRDVLSLQEYNSRSGTISGTIKTTQKEGFIPPKSKITRTLNVLNNMEQAKIDKSLFQPVVVNHADGSGFFRVKEAYFTPENSPLKFKSFINLYVIKDNVPKQFFYQQDFYVSQLMKTAVHPKNIIEVGADQGNKIIRSTTTGYGKVMTGVAIVGAIGAVGAASALTQDKGAE